MRAFSDQILITNVEQYSLSHHLVWIQFENGLETSRSVMKKMDFDKKQKKRVCFLGRILMKIAKTKVIYFKRIKYEMS